MADAAAGTKPKAAAKPESAIYRISWMTIGVGWIIALVARDMFSE
jgi:hypothetical protein